MQDKNQELSMSGENFLLNSYQAYNSWVLWSCYDFSSYPTRRKKTDMTTALEMITGYLASDCHSTIIRKNYRVVICKVLATGPGDRGSIPV